MRRPEEFDSGQRMSRVFPGHKNVTFLTAYEHFDFPKIGGNICGSRTAINQPLTGRERITISRRVD